MTSQLNVDTIVDKAGSGGSNVKMANTSTYVADGGNVTQNTVQSLIKARLNFNGNSNNILGSFNVSSVTDVTNGKYKPAWTNSFSNDDYSATGNHAEDNGLYSNYGAGSMISWFNSSRATNECHVACAVDDDTFRDMRTVEGHFGGDLA